MSAETRPKKWHLCRVHHRGFPDPLYYESLPQYGTWDRERDAQQVRALLMVPEPQELVVRECDPDLPPPVVLRPEEPTRSSDA
jgi:hypothetical protein